MPYNRKNAVNYAEKWAFLRNPDYYNYDKIGGDCTNFVSQCLYAGTLEMNYQRNGWYYHDANRKSPSWTGVEFLYQFLVNNQGNGPRGRIVSKAEIEIGDVIQLSFDGSVFGHATIVTQIDGEKIFVTTHTIDSRNRDIETYSYKKIRYIHIF